MNAFDKDALGGSIAAGRHTDPDAGGGTPVVFLFPGQSGQHPGTGRALYDGEPSFREVIDRGADILDPLIGHDLRHLLYDEPAAQSRAAHPIRWPVVAEPALFVVECALARLWMSRGIEPAALAGDGVGEFAAAAVAGVMRFDDALALVAERGRLMQGTPGGAMLAAWLAEADLRPLLPADVDIAAVVAPTLCVAAGPHDGIIALQAVLTRRTVMHRPMATSHAFHSGMMEPVAAALMGPTGRIGLSPPTLPCISGVTGTWMTPDEATSPTYWAQHCRRVVRLAEALATACDIGTPVLIEVGPPSPLTGLAAQALPVHATHGLVGTLPDNSADPEGEVAFAEAAARLRAAGVRPARFRFSAPLPAASLPSAAALLPQLQTMHGLLTQQLHLLQGTLATIERACELPAAPSAAPPAEPIDTMVPLPPTEIQPADATYWRNCFADPPPPLELPADRPRSAARTGRRAIHRGHLDAALRRALDGRAARLHTDVFTVLFSALQVLLTRLSNQHDVVVAVSRQLGDGTATLPIRAPIDEETSFTGHVRTVASRLAEAEAHGCYAPDGVRGLGLSMAPWPLAAVGLAMMPSADSGSYELFFTVRDCGTRLGVDIDYDADLFDSTTVACWMDHLCALLSAAAADPGRRIGALPMLSAKMRRWLMSEVNDTAANDRNDRLVTELIADQVARQPNATAVVSGGKTLTYGELDARSSRLVRRLRTIEPYPGARIALALPRGLDMVVALLAVLKAGDAYVPTDPADPTSWRAMLDAGAVAVLIAGDADTAALAPPDLPVLRLNTDTEHADPGTPRPAPNLEDAAALLLAGTSGDVRAVEISHRALANLLLAMRRRPGFDADDVMLASSPLATGMAMIELLLPLSVGGRVLIACEHAARCARTMAALVEGCGATVMQATASEWRALIEAGFRPPAGFKMLCGGSLTCELTDRLLTAGTELWALHGALEAAVWSSADRVTPGHEPLAIGAPLRNTQLYILDRNDRLTPVGAVGTLHIGGAGLSGGYFLRPDLTEDVFREVMLEGRVPLRLFRTGDRARRRADGAIELVRSEESAASGRAAGSPALAGWMD